VANGSVRWGAVAWALDPSRCKVRRGGAITSSVNWMTGALLLLLAAAAMAVVVAGGIGAGGRRGVAVKAEEDKEDDVPPALVLASAAASARACALTGSLSLASLITHTEIDR
jgi:hypothetical protein